MTAPAIDLDIDKLLAVAALAVVPSDHRELGIALRNATTGLDLDRLRAALTEVEPRLILGRHHEGPVLGVRWLRPDEVTTVHTHAWTALVQLDGESVLERWIATSAGGAELADSVGVGPGALSLIGEGEPHRQRALGGEGALELAVLGHYDESRPRVELEPGPVTAASAALIESFVGAFRRADADAVAALYAPDVVFDANVPDWRFQVQGREVLATQLAAEEFLPEYRITDWRATPTVTGAAIELESHYLSEGETRKSREMHVLRTGPGGIVRHTLYCTGVWHADVIERQAREAPMVDL